MTNTHRCCFSKEGKGKAMDSENWRLIELTHL